MSSLEKYFTTNKNVLKENKFIIIFWHPHGSVEKPNSILLGLRRYFMNSMSVEKMRKQFMQKIQNAKGEIIKATNWFELLATRPVIVCGASLSSSELDIWLALVSRYRMRRVRNFKTMPIFMMNVSSENKQKIPKGYINHFYPISYGKMCFSNQWHTIVKLFNS